MKSFSAFFAIVFVASAAAAAENRNVLLLISDNQSWFDVGCYGNKIVQTPELDRFAAEGVRFEQAFATTASCGPSRAVIYSGLLTHANGQYAHPHREHNQEIRPEVVTVFETLKNSGYRTGLIGKDHIRPLEKYPIDFKPRISSRDVVKMAKAAGSFFAEDAGNPFFLVVSFSDPHPTSIEGAGWGIKNPIEGYTPIDYDPATIQVPPFLPDNAGVREGLAGYYQQISRMDFGVGSVLGELKNSERQDDTLVIFIADHGTSEPGAMGTHYEPGVRVPFIVRNPEAKSQGIINQALVAFTDITPSILDWADVEFDSYPLHGRSFLPILEVPNPVGWDRALLSHVGHDVFAHYPMRTLRGPRFKLIWNILWRAEYPLPIDTVQRRTWRANRESGAETIGLRTIDQFLHRPQLELYDLENDPWESKNLIDSEDPEIRKIRDSMVAELVGRLETQEDPWMRKYHPLRPGQ
ncbi:MAG: N-sulfoglucosamine sulfohydrolase [Verrucomicrobiales bacterium]|jgi:N-sulfoglucosamine sulfohydrolase